MCLSARPRHRSGIMANNDQDTFSACNKRQAHEQEASWQGHAPELQSDVLDGVPDCEPAAKVGKDPLLHQELVYDGQYEANEDKQHEGNDDGEDDDGDPFRKVEHHA